MGATPDPPGDGLLEVGRITRPHGLRGEVLVELTSDRPERRSVGAVLHSDRGDLVVAEARPHQQRWIIRFEGCERKEDADELRGVVLRGEPLEDEATIWVHEVIGCRVLDRDEVDRGTVVAVVANPAADLLELDSGALVPMGFVTAGPTDGVVHVEVPDGLFDL